MISWLDDAPIELSDFSVMLHPNVKVGSLWTELMAGKRGAVSMVSMASTSLRTNKNVDS
jgi:hypothetical protein